MIDTFSAKSTPEPQSPEQTHDDCASRLQPILLLVLLLLLLSPFHMILKWFTGGRAIVTYWREALVVVIVTGTLIELALRDKRLIDLLPRPGGHVFFAGWLIGSLIVRSLTGLMSGEDSYLAIGGLVIQIVYVPLAIVVYSQLETNAQALRFFYQILIVLSIVSICAVFDWFVRLGKYFDDFGRSALHRLQLDDSYRAYLGADNPMELALYCGCGSVLAFGFLLLFARTLRERLAAVIAWGMCNVAVIGTMSRGPLAAILFCHGMIFVLAGRRRGAGQIARRGLYLALLTVFGLASLLGMKAIGQLPERLDFLVSSMTDTEDESNALRIQCWAKGIDTFCQFPLAGQGLGKAETRFQEYQDLKHGRSMECPESSLLTMAIEGGLFCAAPLVLLALCTVYGAVRGVADTDGSVRGMYVVYLALFMTICIEGLVCPLFTARSPNALFWICYGIFLVLERRTVGQDTQASHLAASSTMRAIRGFVNTASPARAGGSAR